jgi:hypothetical protein
MAALGRDAGRLYAGEGAGYAIGGKSASCRDDDAPPHRVINRDQVRGCRFTGFSRAEPAERS